MHAVGGRSGHPRPAPTAVARRAIPIINTRAGGRVMIGTTSGLMRFPPFPGGHRRSPFHHRPRCLVLTLPPSMPREYWSGWRRTVGAPAAAKKQAISSSVRDGALAAASSPPAEGATTIPQHRARSIDQMCHPECHSTQNAVAFGVGRLGARRHRGGALKRGGAFGLGGHSSRVN